MIHATGQLEASKTHKTRCWSFLAVAGGEHLGTLTIAQGKRDFQACDVEENAVHPAPVREFILRKQSDGETFYSVILAPSDSKCNCTGCGRWGHCKHEASLREALADGVLDVEPVGPTAADRTEMERDYGEWVERFGNEKSDQEQPEPVPLDYAAELLARTPNCLHK